MALIAEMSLENKNWHKEEAPEKKIRAGREMRRGKEQQEKLYYSEMSGLI